MEETIKNITTMLILTTVATVLINSGNITQFVINITTFVFVGFAYLVINPKK